MPSVLQIYMQTENEVRSQSDRDERFTVVQTTRTQRGLLPAAHDETGMTLIHWAALYNKPGEVANLIASGISVNSRTNQNALAKAATPIWIATLYGHNEAASELMKHNPNLYYRPSFESLDSFFFQSTSLMENDSVFQIALQHERAEIMSLLIKPCLQNYINKRLKLEEYTTHYTFLGKLFTFGYSKHEKIEAANALMNFINGSKENSLTRIAELYPAVNQSDLGFIYRCALLAEPFLKPAPIAGVVNSL